ncbi:ClbS/DfsB family four-helix bundle protein [Demequina sp. SYSU T00192]|uniref:ClbS/DfsB family four-helix bundle protein n=1 Tax=Demequina litoralis TaxID=3051660 RepID=A0ABT8GCA9_9MICO|nr:ClbS/DfsB family four-helix bundle protein [Demequina sp. SYSU T00192]MDN4476775.1 ClbS/DfsB family four-helix bundle protein [Demequina sp. SYSU T00192]
MGEAADRIVATADEGLARLLARTDAHRDADLGAVYRDRRVADILTHLHTWHLLLERWLADHAAGRTPAYPADGYTWATLGDLNDALHSAHRHLAYDEARAATVASHARAIAAVAARDDATLTSPDAHPWLDGDRLSAVAHECLGGHYRWAGELLDRAGVPA